MVVSTVHVRQIQIHDRLPSVHFFQFQVLPALHQVFSESPPVFCFQQFLPDLLSVCSTRPLLRFSRYGICPKAWSHDLQIGRSRKWGTLSIQPLRIQASRCYPPVLSLYSSIFPFVSCSRRLSRRVHLKDLETPFSWSRSVIQSSQS